jgi:long-chain acyl-CoA synthetase
MDMATLAQSALERLGEQVTLDFEGQPYTNLQLMDWSQRLQGALTRLGLNKGKVAAMCLINHPMVFSVFGGIFRSGATAVPVMYMLAAPELRYVLMDTKATCVFTDAFSLDKVREATKGLDHIKFLVIVGATDKTQAGIPEYALDDLLGEPPLETLPSIHEEDVAMILYTSGTTGKPKGALLTHANLYASAAAAYLATQFDHWEGRYISVSALPMAHIFGVGVMNSGYMMPEHLADSYCAMMTWSNTGGYMKLIQNHQATVIPVVPTILTVILAHPELENYDLTSLQEVVCGAAPLPAEIAREFSERFGCRIREIYGQTEGTGIGSVNYRSDPYRPGSAGKAYPNHEIRIVDPQGKVLPAGERGEITIQGPAIMKGYLNRPQATAETIGDGWLHSGDMGYLDEDGFLFVSDRIKDMIIRGGENIYPAEIEGIIHQFAGVAEAAVIGVPDTIYGEAVVAFVVPMPGKSLEVEKIIEHVKANTAPFKAPEKVILTDSLPKSAVGKILKRELREIAAKKVNGK